MPILTPSQVHVDKPLTKVTVAYLQSMDNFVADKVFPNVPVQHRTDKYYIYDRENFLRSGDVRDLAPGVETENVGMSLSTDSYSITPKGLGATIDEQTLANADSMLDLRQAKARQLSMLCMIKREEDWATNYFSTGIWDTEYTGVASTSTASQVTHWDDYTNSTPIIDVENAKQAAFLASGGFEPNQMVITYDVYTTLMNHPDIIERMNGGTTPQNPALVNRQRLAEIFGVENLYISRAIRNTAADGASESLGYIMSKKAALFYAPPTPGLMVPAAGYNFTWTSLDNSSGYGVEVMRYQDDALARQHIVEKLECVMAYDQKVVGSEMGIFFNTILS